jgi:hypothetical protein
MPLEERMSHADMWEASADERERLADERERLADEREALAEDRDLLADRHEHELTRREAFRSAHSSVSDAAVEQEAARAALHRAEAALHRAEAELTRAQMAAARVEARANLLAATSERAESAREFERATDHEGRAWLVDRRGFVGAERETIADTRDVVADQRDEMAAAREHLADQREREALERERYIDRQHQAGRSVSAARLSAIEQWQRHADMRARDELRRESAAATRRAAAEARAQAVDAWGPQAYGPMLLGSFARLAGELFGSEVLTDVLPQVLKFTVDMVAGCDWASITQWRHERVVDTVASDPVAAELDDVQFRSGLGPGPEALQSRDPIYTPRLADSGRWPVLAAAAEQCRVASAVSHGLFIRQPGQWSALGVFTLYSQTPDAFGEEDLEFGSILAAFVAVAVAQSRRSADVDRREAALHRALSTRDVIGQAKGILMERQRLSAGEAFDLLRHASQRLNRKVTEVARDLAETGEIPT